MATSTRELVTDDYSNSISRGYWLIVKRCSSATANRQTAAISVERCGTRIDRKKARFAQDFPLKFDVNICIEFFVCSCLSSKRLQETREEPLNEMASHLFEPIASHGSWFRCETQLSDERLLEFFIICAHHVSREELMSHDNTLNIDEAKQTSSNPLIDSIVPLFFTQTAMSRANTRYTGDWFYRKRFVGKATLDQVDKEIESMTTRGWSHLRASLCTDVASHRCWHSSIRQGLVELIDWSSLRSLPSPRINLSDRRQLRS